MLYFKGGDLEVPRSSLLFEFYGPERPGGGGVQAWKAVRTDTWKYIHWTNIEDADELYNLAEDPFEMNNLFTDEKYSAVVKEMQNELLNLRKEYNDPGELLQILME